MGKKDYRFCNLRKCKDFNKKVDLIFHKMCGRLSCVVHGPIYSRFMPGFYCKRFSLYNTTLAFTLYFECYATMPMLADAHISSMGYLWYF